MYEQEYNQDLTISLLRIAFNFEQWLKWSNLSLTRRNFIAFLAEKGARCPLSGADLYNRVLIIIKAARNQAQIEEVKQQN